MARGKPLILSRKPGSEARARRKRDAESRLQSGSLPKNPPAELAGMKAARAAWRQLMKAHGQLPGELFNGLDRGFLVGYCLAVEARQRAADLEKALTVKFQAEELALERLLKARVELRMATRLVSDLEKQLYATPKSRGGVSPAARKLSPDELIDREMAEVEKMLSEEDDSEPSP